MKIGLFALLLPLAPAIVQADDIIHVSYILEEQLGKPDYKKYVVEIDLPLEKGVGFDVTDTKRLILIANSQKPGIRVSYSMYELNNVQISGFGSGYFDLTGGRASGPSGSFSDGAYFSLSVSTAD